MDGLCFTLFGNRVKINETAQIALSYGHNHYRQRRVRRRITLRRDKTQLGSLQYVDSQLARLEAQAVTLQAARIAYGRALNQTLEDANTPEQDEVSIEGLGDSVQFDD
jgi:hypothetical protein